MTDTSNLPAITPKFVTELVGEGVKCHIISEHITSIGNLYKWLQYAPIIGNEYIKLHEENQRLRETLEHIANGCLVPPDGGSPIWPDDAVRSAREALALTKPATDKEESL